LIVPGINDLQTLYPKIALEADGWDPVTMSPGSHRRMDWRCAHGHQWTIAVMDRVRSRGCSVCSGWKVLAGFNDLTVTDSDVAVQADGWDPSTVTAGSSKVRKWRCVLGHNWQTRVSHRTSGSGCPICAGRFVEPGYNDLATTHPELATEAAGWDPRTVSAGSGKNVAWRCIEGHSWTARISSRAGDGIGCPTCAGRKLEPGVNDLASTHPHIAKEADGWDPRAVVTGSTLRKDWMCANGHSWPATVSSRTRYGRNCPFCWGRYVTPGENDLLTLYPEVAAELIDLDPSTIHHGSKRYATWRCSEGHTWEAQVSSRTRKIPTGCRACNGGGGFVSTEPGYLYLVEHEVWGLLQIGITNFPASRIALHQARGWKVLDVRGPMDGILTRAWERDILAMLRTKCADVGNRDAAGAFDGYTEAWASGLHPVTTLHQLIDEVQDGESLLW
jgi:hypothetical protein